MAWDPTLLRKYSNTNHSKLLSQLRSDLKEQPVQRGSSSPSASPRRGGGGSRRRSAPSPQPAPVASQSQNQSTPANSFDPIVTVPVLIESFE